MVARACAQDPRLMILDEPTAFLDLPRRVELMNLLRDLAHREGRAVLLSTHDLDLALRSSDRVWLLPKDGPMQTGLPEDLVLKGDFERAFHGQGVFFDPSTGSFHLVYPEKGKIRLMGSGVPAVWTRRALARKGYIVAAESENTQIEVQVSDRLTWLLKNNGKVTTHESLESLIQELK